MCGATGEQKELEAEQADFYKTAIKESTAVFGQQQDLLKNLTGIFQPILARGPNAMGFSQDELNVLNSQAVEGTASNYKKAATALNEKLAAQGGGDIPLTTGAQAQLQGELASSSAGEESSEQTQILEGGYQQGYTEFSDATKGLEDVASQLSPTSYMGETTGAGSAAASTADQIAQENNSWINAALGAAGSLGGAAIGKIPGGTPAPAPAPHG